MQECAGVQEGAGVGVVVGDWTCTIMDTRTITMVMWMLVLSLVTALDPPIPNLKTPNSKKDAALPPCGACTNLVARWVRDCQESWHCVLFVLWTKV